MTDQWRGELQHFWGRDIEETVYYIPDLGRAMRYRATRVQYGNGRVERYIIAADSLDGALQVAYRLAGWLPVDAVDKGVPMEKVRDTGREDPGYLLVENVERNETMRFQEI